MKRFILIAALPLLMVGCTTSTYVKLPKDAVLKLSRDEQVAYKEGKLERNPLSWSSAAGIPYRIEKNGRVIQEGKMSSKFRPVSIFWPPVALAYWPTGFRESCYDFTRSVAAQCSPSTLQELQAKGDAN